MSCLAWFYFLSVKNAKVAFKMAGHVSRYVCNFTLCSLLFLYIISLFLWKLYNNVSILTHKKTTYFNFCSLFSQSIFKRDKVCISFFPEKQLTSNVTMGKNKSSGKKIKFIMT